MRTMTDDDANKNKSSSTNLYDPARPPPFSPSCGTHFRWSAKMFLLQFVYNNFITNHLCNHYYHYMGPISVGLQECFLLQFVYYNFVTNHLFNNHFHHVGLVVVNPQECCLFYLYILIISSRRNLFQSHHHHHHQIIVLIIIIIIIIIISISISISISIITTIKPSSSL